jgi:hypothetical protein
VRRPLHARVLMGLEGIQLPLAPPTIINGPDPHAPSATASPLLDLLHMA